MNTFGLRPPSGTGGEDVYLIGPVTAEIDNKVSTEINTTVSTEISTMVSAEIEYQFDE